MDTWETVVRLISEKKLKKGVFADRLDISRQTLDNWLKDETSPDQKDLRKMSKILEEFPNEIRGSIPAKTVSITREGKVPFYDVYAMGGHAILADQSPIGEPVEYVNPGDFLKKATGTLRVYGHSSVSEISIRINRRV